MERFFDLLFYPLLRQVLGGKFKILFFLIFLPLLVPKVYCLTLSQIRTEIRRNLRDNVSARQRYTDDTLLDYINQAQRDIVNETWLSMRTTSYVLTANTTYYDLPTDMIVISQVYFKDKSGST